MSAAADPVPTADPAPVPAPRVTGARLMRRMKSSPEVKRRLANMRLIPPDGERMLRAVADLVAGAGGERFTYGSRLCPGGLAEEVAIHRKLFGPVEEIERTLQALAHAELIVVETDAVKLVLPPEPLPVPPPVYADDGTGRVIEMPGARPPPVRPGRPRRGETQEEYRARARRMAQHQQSLPLPPTMVRHGWADEDVVRTAGLRTALVSRPESPAESPRLSESPTYESRPDFPGGDFSRTSGLAVVVGGVDSSPVDELNQQDNPTTTTTTVREADFRKVPEKSDFLPDFSGADFSGADFSGADFSDGAAGPDLPRLAEALAGPVIRELRLRNGAAEKAAPWILERLQSGLPPELLVQEFLAGFERHKREPIRAISWFDRPVTQAAAAWRARAAPPHPAYARAQAPPGPADRCPAAAGAPLSNPFAELRRQLSERRDATANAQVISGKPHDTG